MPKVLPTRQKLRADNEDLHARLEKAEETLREILSGEGDALFVKGAGGAQLYALDGADQSYRTLIENMSEAALTLTSEGVIVYANRRFAEMLGTPLEKVIGSEIHAWFAPDSRGVLRAILRKDAIGNRPQELNLAATDGTRVPVYVSVNRLLLDGVPDSLCMVATDLTEQKRNESILAEEKLARAVLEQSADSIVICDASGRIIRASQQAQAFFEQDLLGQLFEHAFPLRQPDGTAFAPIGAIDTNRRQSVDARLERNGKWFDFLVSVGHLKGAGGQLLGSVVTLTEITERKQTAQALLETTQRLDGIVTSAVDAIVTMDEDERIVLSNPAAERMFGYTVGELKGRPLEVLLPVRFRTAHSAHVAAFGRAGLTSRMMGELRPVSGLRKNGEEFPIEASISQDESTGRRLYTAILRDITERIQADDRIVSLNRVYAMLSGINTLIVRVRDRGELFKEACQIAVDAGGFRMTWIGMVDQRAMNLVPVASAGMDEAMLSALKTRFSSSEAAPLGNTMAERAIMEKQVLVSNDLQRNPNVLLGKEYAEREVCSMALLPLIVSDEAVGVLGLYAGEIEFFHEEELKLLRELAGDIAFAIDHIDKQARLDYLATHDILTDLPNRSLMRDRITRAISHAKRAGRQLALMYLDLDRFKVINDGYGHPFGDAVLKAAGERMASVVRDEDSVARQSGDEFLVLLVDLRKSDDAYIIAQKMLEAFEQPFLLQGHEVYVTVSIGVSVYPQDGEVADALIGNADVAMYRSKELGRGTYQFFTQTMSEQTQQRVELETQLRVAIAQDQMHLVYQPKIDLASGRITGCEALLRWSHPELGSISPARFIPIAEESGLIVPIGNWVLRTACRQNKAWLDAGLPAVVVSVNISARQFLHQDVLAWVLRTLEESALAPELLELELTESLIAQDTEKVIATISQLKAAGVRHSIDDFGTGYSNLSYLKRFRVDTLKIDQSFIRNMLKDPDDAVIALAVISLGHSFRMKVIAEGVETAEHCALLRLHGCDEIQGYYFSKPVPPGDFETMLKNGKTLVQEGRALHL